MICDKRTENHNFTITTNTSQHVEFFHSLIFAGSLESANSSILTAQRLFKDLVGEKNQDFMIIRYPIS